MEQWRKGWKESLKTDYTESWILAKELPWFLRKYNDKQDKEEH